MLNYRNTPPKDLNIFNNALWFSLCCPGTAVQKKLGWGVAEAFGWCVTVI